MTILYVLFQKDNITVQSRNFDGVGKVYKLEVYLSFSFQVFRFLIVHLFVVYTKLI